MKGQHIVQINNSKVTSYVWVATQAPQVKQFEEHVKTLGNKQALIVRLCTQYRK